ncbi:Ribosomal large subunit pseudouridine synthase B [Corynebacterium occultum]|uniref:Pseudouridine synthase n=1 Tax=Corynebacterium occultum TaxID=2675219 RepID=A0A6B8VT39_9CORY|nr:pseudouridine synthase [Corynebacterium occultum]QGU07303.1 Ribosomal large subunit pseudouridine synthase B [Corynebacterium occultum]
MTPPARRDGTPDKKGFRGNARGAANGRRSNPNSGQPTPPRKPREDIVSHAKPAKRQNVNISQRRQSGEGQGEGTRLQKVLAQAGVASRRHAEILIDAGRVEVNDKIVTIQGMRVNPNVDVIRVDGVRIKVNEELEYFILNKPRGMQSTMDDELGRPCVGDLLSEKTFSGQRLFHVGRLDADTEGLLLLTNDGELANRLMHPRYKITKTYLATVLGEADRALINALRDGIELEDGPAKADFAQIIDTHNGKSLIRVELHEGRKHIVRRMLKEMGYPVQYLVRTKLHTLQLGEQKPGSMRSLNTSELSSLYKAVGM